jgi:hypothetical protein
MRNDELSWKAFEELPLWKQASSEQRGCALSQPGSSASPAKLLATLEHVLRTRPELAASHTVSGDNQNKKAVVDQRPSPRPPLRRARLDQHGNAITWTETGVIINDLEIIHEPTRDEASQVIGARQRKYMHAGVEAHVALAQALEEVPPVYRTAYVR